MRNFLIAAFCLLGNLLFAQQNMSLLGTSTFNQTCSDIWGYAANGREYALVGLYNGISIVDVTNPANPVQLQYIPGNGPGTDWWDLKTWGNYAYVTNEGGGGMMIVDLSNLPGTATYTHWTTGSYTTAHNIFIDENGVAYLCGMNILNGGVLMLDVNANPTNPPILGNYTRRYVHDLYVRGDTMWVAEIDDAEFSVVDITNKAAPVVLASRATTGATTHNLWLTNDGQYLLTTDEVSNAYIDAYDVSDLSNISRLDVYQSSPGQNVIPHNVFIKDNFGIISYYRDGVVIIDITYPENMIEVGNYDTSPFSGSGFNGCWGVYPYLPSGNIIATDIEEGLFVLGVNYIQAAQLDGTVRDSNTNQLINAATVALLNTTTSTSTNSNGQYATGILSSGLYNVLYSKAGYISHVETNVALQNGLRTTRNVKLLPSTNLGLTIQVIDSATGNGIKDAKVLLEGASGFSGTYTTNTGGTVTLTLPTDYYDIYAGRWGHITQKISGIVNTPTLTITLGEGYYDDFVLDFNWTETSTATTGDWVRDEPLGTDFNGDASNPGADVSYDYGNQAFVTGNSATTAGGDDIDDGTVTLFSPYFDLSSYNDPILKYARWFYNDGGSSAPNDNMQISIQTGANGTPVLIENITSTANNWTPQSFVITDFTTPADSMRLIIAASDFNPGHLVEGGFDAFAIIDSIPPLTAPVAAFSTPDTSICENSSITFTDLSTENPSSWAWSFPGGFPTTSTLRNPVITYTTSGTYDVQLIVSNSIGADTLTKTTYITVNTPPGLVLSVTAPSCNGDSNATVSVADTSGTGIANIIWSTGATTASLNSLAAGNYDVTVTNLLGCAAAKTARINNPARLQISSTTTNASSPTATDGTATIVVSGGTPPYTVTWPQSLGITTEQTMLATGNYTLTITDSKGCTTSNTITVGAEVGTGITNLNQQFNWQLLPNPFTESIQITAPAATGSATVSILDINGSLVWQNNVQSGSITTWGHNAAPGVYLVNITTDGNRKTLKVVKTNK